MASSELLFPSLFDGSGKTTRESDIYAFGMTAFEVRIHGRVTQADSDNIKLNILQLFTEKVPFHDIMTTALPLEIAVNHLEPSWPGHEAEARGLTAEIWGAMRNCWKYEPSSRMETFYTDLAELALTHMSNLRVISCPWINDLRDYTLGILQNVFRTAWSSNTWNAELEYFESDPSNVSARIIRVSEDSGLDINQVRSRNVLDCLKTHPSSACQRIATLPK